MKNLLRIATRKSALALWQADHIRSRLMQIYPKLTIELLEITTSGDKNLDDPLYKIGGKRLFVKELEQALLTGHADIAVHSMKDVPMDIPDSLTIAVTCEREDPRDVLLSNHAANLASLPAKSIIGTTSLRRMCQLLSLRPDLQVKPLRGNVDTRLHRLDENKYDAIILAAAGIRRLGFQNRITEFFPTTKFLPAAGQGALAIEARLDDRNTLEMVKPLNHVATQHCISAERALNQSLDGGCQVPIAAYADLDNDQLTLRGLVGSPDGKLILRAHASGKAADAAIIGMKVAADLLAQGAGEILRATKILDNSFGA